MIIFPAVYTHANLCFKPFCGASPQIGETLRFCDFFLVGRLVGWSVGRPVGYTVFFSRARAQVEPVDGFSRVMAHTTCFRASSVLSGVATIPEFIWGDIQELRKMGVKRQFQAKGPNIIIVYFAKYDPRAVLGEYYDHQTRGQLSRPSLRGR